MNSNEKQEYKDSRSTIAMMLLNGLLSNTSFTDHNITTLVDISLDTAEAFIKEVESRDEILDQKYPDNNSKYEY